MVAQAQNYTNFPLISFSASPGMPVVSGTSVTLSFNVPVTSGTDRCILAARSARTHSSTNESCTGGTQAVTVNPTSTTVYTFQDINTGGCPNSSGCIVEQTLTVFVGTGALNVTESTAAADYGAGCGSRIASYSLCEITYTLPGAGCAKYVSTGTTTAPCVGGTVSNPWEDVQGWATFAGQTSGNTYTVGLFYENTGFNGNGNNWKIRFAPPNGIAETWNYTITLADPTNYKTFTHTGLFTSVADTNNPGFLSLYGSGSPYILKTGNGAPFYPVGINLQLTDAVGNGGVSGIQLGQTIGQAVGVGNTFTLADLGTYADGGFNFFSITDSNSEQILASNIGGAAVNTYITYGEGGANGTTYRGMLGGVAADSALMAVRQIYQQAHFTPESQPSAYVPGLDVFTSASATQAFLHAWQYYINRFGAFVSVWNTGNEITSNASWEATINLWIKQQDPYKHLVSVSNGSACDFVKDQNLDINGPHCYINPPPSPNFAAQIASDLASARSSVPNVPVIVGETGYSTSEGDDPGVNERLLDEFWGALLSRGFITPEPEAVGNGIPAGGQIFVGTPQLIQTSILSTFIANSDPLATTFTGKLANGSGGQTLGYYALGSTNWLGVYIDNTTNSAEPAGATFTFTTPEPGMPCSWLNPATGALLSSFTGTGSSQVQTVPFTPGNIFAVLMQCFAITNPVVTTTTAPAALVGSSYNLSLAASGGAGGPYTWAVTAGALPPGITLSSGVISGMPTVAMFWHVSVQVTDSAGNKSVAQPLIIPVIPTIGIGTTAATNSTALPVGAFEPPPISVIGGAQPIKSCTITFMSGAPAGITAGPWCTLSGTAASTGTFPFTAQAEDALGNLSPVAFLNLIVPSLTEVVEPSFIPPVTAGYVYTSTGIGAYPIAGTFTWTATPASPCGLVITAAQNPHTTYLAGTPPLNTSGPCSFTLVADSTSGGGSPPQTFAPAVNLPPSLATVTLPAYTVGSMYYQALSVAYGSAPTWCVVTTGSLPPGFVLDSANCYLYGLSASPGSFEATITVWDANHAGASSSYEVSASASTTLPAPSITSGGIVPVDSTVTAIQPGEWVSIYGTNLASSTATWTGNFPTSLGGTSVTIDGIAAYLSYVSPGQINLQAPNDTFTGPVPVVVTTASGTSASTVTLAQFAPSFLLLDSKHVAGIILRSDGSGAYDGGTYDIIGPTGDSLGYPTVAAKAGDTLELYAVGLGPTNPSVPAGQAFSGAAQTADPVALFINNVSVTPSFAGLSSAGLDQINLTVAAGLGAGDVALVATVGRVQTQAGVVISLQ
jgi:uncharacterized protein (TIGR03437 family)